MKIAVIGGGAIGSIVAGLLAKQGVPVGTTYGGSLYNLEKPLPASS